MPFREEILHKPEKQTSQAALPNLLCMMGITSSSGWRWLCLEALWVIIGKAAIGVVQPHAASTVLPPKQRWQVALAFGPEHPRGLSEGARKFPPGRTELS